MAGPGSDLTAAKATRDVHDCNRTCSNVIEPVVRRAMDAAGRSYTSVEPDRPEWHEHRFARPRVSR